jgi:hypothetical protein
VSDIDRFAVAGALVLFSIIVLFSYWAWESRNRKVEVIASWVTTLSLVAFGLGTAWVIAEHQESGNPWGPPTVPPKEGGVVQINPAAWEWCEGKTLVIHFKGEGFKESWYREAESVKCK